MTTTTSPWRLEPLQLPAELVCTIDGIDVNRSPTATLEWVGTTADGRTPRGAVLVRHEDVAHRSLAAVLRVMAPTRRGDTRHWSTRGVWVDDASGIRRQSLTPLRAWWGECGAGVCNTLAPPPTDTDDDDHHYADDRRRQKRTRIEDDDATDVSGQKPRRPAAPGKRCRSPPPVVDRAPPPQRAALLAALERDRVARIAALNAQFAAYARWIECNT